MLKSMKKYKFDIHCTNKKLDHVLDHAIMIPSLRIDIAACINNF